MILFKINYPSSSLVYINYPSSSLVYINYPSSSPVYIQILQFTLFINLIKIIIRFLNYYFVLNLHKYNLCRIFNFLQISGINFICRVSQQNAAIQDYKTMNKIRIKIWVKIRINIWVKTSFHPRIELQRLYCYNFTTIIFPHFYNKVSWLFNA